MRNPASQGAADANQAALADVYRQLGCSVTDTHELGGGFPDLVIGIGGRTELAECKAKDGRQTPAQITFTRDHRGSLVRIVRSADDVIAHVRDVRRKIAKS